MQHSLALRAVMTMTAGTVFLMWLGEQIDEYGIGNGISLLIMAGILARMPTAVNEVVQPILAGGGLKLGGNRGQMGVEMILVLIVLFVGVVAGRGVHQPGAAADSHAKRQARPRPPRFRRHAAIPAAAGEPGRRHAHHLRQQLVVVPGDVFRLFDRQVPQRRLVGAA